MTVASAVARNFKSAIQLQPKIFIAKRAMKIVFYVEIAKMG